MKFFASETIPQACRPAWGIVLNFRDCRNLCKVFPMKYVSLIRKAVRSEERKAALFIIFQNRLYFHKTVSGNSLSQKLEIFLGEQIYIHVGG